MTQEVTETYSRALTEYGFDNQRMMLFEEIGELLNAIAKHHRGRTESVMEVITELADVSIMVEQMAVHFGLGDFEREKQRKIERLNKRIQEHKNQ